MKTALSIALFALLAGCASVAPSQFYRPANYAGAPLVISGQFNEMSNGVVVTINGKQVAAGSISLLSGDGEFSGEYEGKPVQASCATSMGLFESKTRCHVFISGERAATLSF